MKTHEDLAAAIRDAADIKCAGFSPDWVLLAFARKQALLNINMLRPYTDRYALIVEYLLTGRWCSHAATAAQRAAAAANDAEGDDAVHAAHAAVAAAAAASTVRIVYVEGDVSTDSAGYTDADSATAAIAAATHAAHATEDYDYTESISVLRSIVNEHTKYITKKVMTLADIEKVLGYGIELKEN